MEERERKGKGKEGKEGKEERINIYFVDHIYINIYIYYARYRRVAGNEFGADVHR